MAGLWLQWLNELVTCYVLCGGCAPVSTQRATAQHVVHAAGGSHNHVHASLEDTGVLTHAGSSHACMALHLQEQIRSTSAS